MNLISKKIIPFTLLVILMISSCNKDEEKCVAGTGGNLTILAFPKHHGTTIPNLPNYPDTVFVKFNTQDSPGSSQANYDTYFVGEVGQEYVKVFGLKCGEYYFMGVGFDTTINERVVGGMPFSTDQIEGELNLTLAVTE